MNNSSITNKPIFQCSAGDTKTIASPLTSAEIKEINRGTQMLTRWQKTAAMFDLFAFKGEYIYEPFLRHSGRFSVEFAFQSNWCMFLARSIRFGCFFGWPAWKKNEEAFHYYCNPSWGKHGWRVTGSAALGSSFPIPFLFYYYYFFYTWQSPTNISVPLLYPNLSVGPKTQNQKILFRAVVNTAHVLCFNWRKWL